MVTALFGYLKSMGSGTIKKRELQDHLDNVIAGIQKNVIPALDSTIKEYRGSNITTKESLLGEVYQSKDYRYVEDMLSKVMSVLKLFTKYDNDIYGLLDDLDEEIYTKGLTLKQSFVLKVINDLYTISAYTIDLSILLIEYKTGEPEESIFPKKIKEDKLNYLYDYFSLVNFYSDFKKIINGELSDIVLDVDEKELATLRSLIPKGTVNMPITGFIGNPIYHFRVFLVDREIKKIELLKEKKEYLELIILEKEKLRNGTVDPKLEKQIEFYKEEVAKVEHTIEKSSKV